ncbi:MAG TPA: lysyl oxidase family protein [Thermoleophilaceae bacterium]
MGRLRTRLAIAAATAAAALTLGAAPAGAALMLLPDFDQEAPWDLTVEPVVEGGETHYRLGFFSAVDNVGDGPARLLGHRDDTSVPGMRTRQVVDQMDGTAVAFEDVGEMQYVADPSHRHWHFMRFETYELRSAESPYGLVRPDSKRGFCLGDRYETDPGQSLPNEPAGPAFTEWCHVSEADRLDSDAGISVGWGDVYEPLREGQYIDVTGVPAGRYDVVHRVNPDHLLRERTFENNTASRLVEISYPDGPGGAPEVRTLDVCEVGARCGTGSDEPIWHPPSDWLAPDAETGPFSDPGPGPGGPGGSQESIPGSTPTVPSLSRRQAILYARIVTRDRFWRAPSRSVRSCAVTDRTHARCSLAWRRGRSLYAGSVSIGYTLRAGTPWWRYSARVTRRAGGRKKSFKASGTRRAAVGT